MCIRDRRVEVYEKYISGDALSDVETQVEEVTKEKETNKIYVVESGCLLYTSRCV